MRASRRKAPTLAAIDYPAMELYAMPAATNTLLDDSQVDIEQWLAGEVQIVFAEQEGAAFISGNGTTQPKGFLTETVVADVGLFLGQARLHRQRSGRRVRRIQSDRCTGHARLCAASQGYRANGTWVMNRKTESLIRKFKDSDRQLHLAARLRCGPAADACSAIRWRRPRTCPIIASGSLSIAFGDFARGYLVVDRVGIRALRDPYSAPSPMCCSTRPSASAAAYRTSKPSS